MAKTKKRKPYKQRTVRALTAIKATEHVIAHVSKCPNCKSPLVIVCQGS